MKFDKDLLIKHRFWILLGLFVLIWIVNVVMIKTYAAGIGAAKKKDFEASKSNINAAEKKSPKNQSFNDPWDKYAQTFRSQKEKVWSDAWKVQETMYDWPSNADAQLDRLKYPDDEIKYVERITYYETLWKSQFNGLMERLAPIEFAGGKSGFERIMMPGFTGNSDGARSVAGGGGGAPVSGGDVWSSFWKNVPSEEECWLAQEDFWIKRELLSIVKDAVDNVARFKEITDDEVKKEPLPEGIAARHRFRNNLWEIDLLIEQKGRKGSISRLSTIKNLHPTKRVVPLTASADSNGLGFLLKQKDHTFSFRVDGEPLPYGASSTFRKTTSTDSIDFKQPFELMQDFEWANCPIKTIQDIQIGKHAHRTAHMAFLPSLLIKPKAEDAAASATAPAGGGKPHGPGKPGGGAPPASPPGGGAGGGGAASGGNATPNGLQRLRYVFVTPQCRHVPVALLLIVDQTHLHEVLVAMSNSRLRVQTTQVQFHHVHGIHSQKPENAPARAVAAGPQQPPARMRGEMPGQSYKHRATTSAESDDDPNLVELAVYGIASLYERFPPKPPPSKPS